MTETEKRILENQEVILSALSFFAMELSKKSFPCAAGMSFTQKLASAAVETKTYLRERES